MACEQEPEEIYGDFTLPVTNGQFDLELDLTEPKKVKQKRWTP